MSARALARAGIRVLGALCAFGLISVTLAAQQPVPSSDRARPDYDSRDLQARRPAMPPAAAAALDRLRQQTGRPLRVRLHPLSGAVRRLTADGPLTAPSVAPPAEIAAAFLLEHHDLLGLTEEDARALVKVREYSSHNETTTHLTFEQVIEGIPVFEGVVGIHVAADGAIVWLTNDTVPSRGGPRRPARSVEEAIRAAVADVRPSWSIALSPRSGPSGDDERSTFDAAPFVRPIEARLVYFPTDAGARLAWWIFLEPPGLTEAYIVILDATSARVLYRRNTYHDADGAGRVFQSAATAALDPRKPEPYPLGTAASNGGDPPAGCPPPDAYNLVSLNGAFRDPATVLANGGHLTGNNATVYRGRAGVWGALGANEAGTWRFDFPFNTADSAETAVFFALNFAHDLFYDLGFDEAAGNFQVDNLGRGGTGGDPLVAIARAPGRNNATIEVPPEGKSPTMNLFLWDGRGCWAADVDGDGALDLDGDYDTDIILHEYHHGVTFRLNPAWSGAEAGAIGEGGSDFFAYSVYGETSLAGYSAPPAGIRHVNAKTYADWYCLFGLICEVHDNGEIWANVLWDLRERFRAAPVGGSEDAAIGELHQLYIDGLKLSPASPTMLDLRDAMLMADRLRNPSADPGGSANACRMWTTFAQRGMGAAARDTKDTGVGTVVADWTMPAACPAPATVTIAATTAGAAEAGAASGILTVSRTGDSSSDVIVNYTVAGTATAGSDYVALAGSVTIPAGATSAEIAVAPIDDLLYESNETVVVTLATDPAYFVGAPSSATVTIASDDLAPDLVVSALAAPAVTGAGLTLDITDTTANQGPGAAAAATTRFYLSVDLIIDARDIPLGDRGIGTLAAGTASAGVTTVTVPSSTPAGSYFLMALADADKVVPEREEGNNTKWAWLKVGPDLVVTALTAPVATGAGATIIVTDTTANQGGAPAGASRTRFYLSTNVLLDAGDRLLEGSRSVPSLGVAQTSSGSTSLTIPLDVQAGQYFLLAQADAENAVAESVETNNAKYAPIRIGPDLGITAVTAPAEAAPGAAIVVTDTTANHGGGTAGPSTTGFYLSVDTLLSAADVRLQPGRAVASLAAGASSAGSTLVTIPAGTSPGRYYVVAVADADGAVQETIETNNTRFAPLAIGGDLIVSSLVAPATAGAGSAVAVTDTTMNRGPAPVAASTTRFYLSVDTLLSAADVRLEPGRAVASLAAGASSSGTTSVTIPPGTATGAYFLIAKADADGAVVEGNETNNTRYVQVRVGPDLVVTAVTGPSSARAGTAVTVTDTTANQGGGSAGGSVTRFYLSTNTILDAADVPLGAMRAVPALAAGANSTGQTAVTIPAGTAPGYYFLFAKADDGQVVTETFETNNTRFMVLQVLPPGS